MIDNPSKIRTVAFLLGGMAVLLGAFGAHGLKGILSAKLMNTWHTGVLYHFVHVFLLLVLSYQEKTKLCRLAIINCVAGIALFSGSLYAYCLTSLSIFALITPVGGVCFVLAWGVAAWASYGTQPNSA